MRTAIVALLIVGVGIFFYFDDRGVELGPGVKAPDAPRQEKVNSPESFTFKNYRITPLAKFQIQAKVLSREDYWFGREADLSPVDFALGWQRMSDEAILESIDISQSNRWYFWRVDQFPIPRKEIETSSANMHLIPADDAVASQVDDVRKGGNRGV